MKIAVFIKATTFHKLHGGLETQNKTLCEGLARLGHKVVVFSPRRELDFTNKSHNGVDYVFIESDYRYLFYSLNKNNWFHKSIKIFKEYHEKTPFDVVISQSSAGVGIISNKSELNVKVISIAHGTIMAEIQTALNNIYNFRSLFFLLRNLQYALRQFFGRQRDYILHADHVVAVSNSVKRQLIEETYIPEERISVIHNGIYFPQTGEVSDNRQQGFVMLFVGQIIPEKGIDALTRIFEDPRLKSTRLHIIGDGRYMSDLKTKILKNKLENNIKIFGSVPHEELVSIYNSGVYSAFLFPTRRVEGFPMVLVEAMYGGIPIIGYNLGGVSDAIDNGETGYLVPFKDFDQFKDKIYYFMSHPDEVWKMGEASRKKAQSLFSADVMIERYISIFERLVQ
ncbi:glycosyltransferase family 1 protein [candidate division WWE3 bacterium]|jgi:glycosyltransferase involved in cell wall biosynthesis|uniref:Glycosyltransferase family 1 protein n=1 Tax=candidate division WWE3 bacterium TaxID=2053526 RepID=A0A3A4ZAR5_UNCKA|nr:MAG: glycosyltransferase family 1 protein [candidate division WWE3 bacterium]